MPAEEFMENSIGFVLLAAGNSSRLGKPKQLLVQQAVNVAHAVKSGPVIVVLGARATDIKDSFDPGNAQVVVNADWQEGMASSIRCGITALLAKNTEVEGAILMVCDQPFVTSPLLHELITAHQTTQQPIVACSYENTFGPPVFFHHSLFPDLLHLHGDIGARSVIRQHANKVAVVSFAKGSNDVDTERDYEQLSRQG
jgi:molybdenum cofactor cytidylyltransferase